MKLAILSLLLFSLTPLLAAAVAPLTWTSRTSLCAVQAQNFLLSVSSSNATPVTWSGTSPVAATFGVCEVWLVQGGVRYSADFTDYSPQLHFLRGGPYLVEEHLENIVLTNGVNTWPGLLEISIYCQQQRVFMSADFICNTNAWVVRRDTDGSVRDVYAARIGFTNCPAVTPNQAGLRLSFSNAPALPVFASGTNSIILTNQFTALMPTVPAGLATFSRESTNSILLTLSNSVVWLPGTLHQLGLMATLSPDFGTLGDVINQFKTESGVRFTMQQGSSAGYAPDQGLFKLQGTGSPSGTPAPGTRAGTRFTAVNNGTARGLLVDQLDTWGGISGGQLQDTNGVPLPLPVQLYVNYPELASYGETGNARLVYPLALAAGQSFSARGVTFFSSGTDRDLAMLDSLEPASSTAPGIQQFTIDRQEALTVRMSPFLFTDFRKHEPYNPAGSASAAAVKFLTLTKPDGTLVQLNLQSAQVIETGPWLFGQNFAVASPNGEVTGNIRLWGDAPTDINRWHCDVDLTVQQGIALTNGPDALKLISFTSPNPMAYRKFAWRSAAGSTEVVTVLPYNTYTRTAVRTNIPLGGTNFWFGLFNANNAGGSYSVVTNGVTNTVNVTISDRAGNPFAVVQNFQVTIGGLPKTPAGWMWVGSSADQYRRELAISTYNPPSALNLGDRIHFSCVGLTAGDEFTTETMGEAEFAAWSGGLQAVAHYGQIVTNAPLSIRSTLSSAWLTLTNGTNWVPIRVLSPPGALSNFTAYYKSVGNWSNAAPATAGEPWYQAATDPVTGETSISFTVPVSSEPVDVVVSGGDANGDGIPDATQGFGDSNGNGIPDFLDGLNTSPVINSVEVTGRNLILGGTNGLPYGTYSVRSFTNVASALTNWPVIATGSFDPAGQFRVTNAVNPAEPGRFYLFSQP